MFILYLCLSVLSTSVSLIVSLAHLTTSGPFKFSFTKTDVKEKAKETPSLEIFFLLGVRYTCEKSVTVLDYLTLPQNLTVHS